MKTLICSAVFLALLFCSCTTTQKGAGSGAVVGGLIGGIIGHNQDGHTAEGAAIGALAGGLLGGVAGNELENQKDESYRRGYEDARRDQDTVTY